MTTDSYPGLIDTRPARGFSVHCTQGALGEWFTVIPRSSDQATVLRGRGVAARASLTADEVRGQLARLGLSSHEIGALMASARGCSTLITAAGRTGRWNLRHLFA